MLLRLLRWWASGRQKIVIGDPAAPYMTRWYLIPRNRWFNVYLHQFHRSDDDRALHDHPWWSLSLLLSGVIAEQDDGGTRFYRAGTFRLRSAQYRHRIELTQDTAEVWTLFVTGPRLREWGFHCPRGWVHWKVFTTGENGEQIGRGCD